LRAAFFAGAILSAGAAFSAIAFFATPFLVAAFFATAPLVTEDFGLLVDRFTKDVTY
jgi:hypothetical protein